MSTTASAWPKVGDPPFGYVHATDCPAEDDPDGTGYAFICTRDAGHPMPHVADGFEAIVHVWADSDEGA